MMLRVVTCEATRESSFDLVGSELHVFGVENNAHISTILSVVSSAED